MASSDSTDPSGWAILCLAIVPLFFVVVVVVRLVIDHPHVAASVVPTSPTSSLVAQP